MQQAASDWHGFDPEIGAPYARDVLADGTVVRIETDGYGGTIAIPEGRVTGSSYGIDSDLPRTLRDRFDQVAASKPNTDLPSPDLQRLVLRELESAGPLTKDDLADRIGTWRYNVEDALGKLARKGLCECFPHEAAKGHKYLWRGVQHT